MGTSSGSTLLTEYGYLISFVNGLALFALGLTVALEQRRTGRPKLAGPLRLLSAYGFCAAIANWLRVLMVTGLTRPAPTAAVMSPVAMVRLLAFVLGGAALLQFAAGLVADVYPALRRVRAVGRALLVVYPAAIIVLAIVLGGERRDWGELADIGARYLLFFPGLSLAAVGCLGEVGRFRAEGLRGYSADGVVVAIAFAIKAFTSGIAAIPVYGRAASQWPGLALGVFVSRVVTNVAIAVFTALLLRGLERERHRRYVVAVEDRAAAQRDAIEAQRQVHAEVERWAAQLEDAVDGISSVISSASSLEAILDVSLEHVLHLAGFEAGDMRIHPWDAAPQPIIRQSGLSHDVRSCEFCLASMGSELSGADQVRHAVAVREVHSDPAMADSPCRQAGFRWVVSVPVVCQSRVLGVMNLLGTGDNAPHPSELRVLSAIGQQIGVAVENVRLRELAKSAGTFEERGRLGRDLHDGVGQVLSYLQMKSYGTAGLVGSGELDAAQAELREMQEVARDAVEDLRGSILGLRTTTDCDTDVIMVLADYVQSFTRVSGIDTQLVVEGRDLALSPIVGAQLLCIVQEALVNARRHAEATRAWVRVKVQDGLATVEIDDDGQGFALEGAVKEGHFGLQTMKERAESVDGEWQIAGGPGRGTRVIVKLPVAGGGA